MILKKFDPPSIEDIQERFINGGVAALTDEDVATLLGHCEACEDRLKIYLKTYGKMID